MGDVLILVLSDMFVIFTLMKTMEHAIHHGNLNRNSYLNLCSPHNLQFLYFDLFFLDDMLKHVTVDIFI